MDLPVGVGVQVMEQTEVVMATQSRLASAGPSMAW